MSASLRSSIEKWWPFQCSERARTSWVPNGACRSSSIQCAGGVGEGCHATRKLVTKSSFVSAPVLPSTGTTCGVTRGAPMRMWISVTAASASFSL